MFNQLKDSNNPSKLNEKLSLVKQFSDKGGLENLLAAYVILKNVGKQNEEDKAVRGWKGRIFTSLNEHIHHSEEVNEFLAKLSDELKKSSAALKSKL